MTQVGRPYRKHAARGPADILGVAPGLPLRESEDLVARLEGSDIPPDGFDLSGEHHSEDGPTRSPKTKQQVREKSISQGSREAPGDAVARRHGSGNDPDAYLALARRRPRD